MQYRSNFLGILITFFIFTAFLVSCGSSGDSSSSGSGGFTNTQTATLKGTIADVVAKEQLSTRSFLIAKLNEILTFSKNAVAQEEVVDLSGITVQAFDEMSNLVGEGISDVNGNFEFTVPCDTPLTLEFSSEGSSVVLGPVVVPCPEGEEEAVLFITVNLNFNEESTESGIESEEEELIGNAKISCNNEGNEPIIEEGADLIIDGEGDACIITAGNCDLVIKGANVELTNCSSCIDTRGNSSLKIEANNFTCESVGDGIRSVGTSYVDIKLVAPEEEAQELICDDGIDNDMDGDIDCADSDCAADPVCTGPVEICDNGIDDDTDGDIDCADSDCAEDPLCGGIPEICDNGIDDDMDGDTDCADSECTEAPECVIIECGALSIISDEDGVDARGNSSVKLDGEGDGMEGESSCGDITITGMENSIIAVGNSGVEVKGTSCTLDPEEPVAKGNAEVNVECDGGVAE